MDAASAREYFWGCTLTEENPAMEWTFEEEDDDKDFFSHTLFLKGAVLGAAGADLKSGEVHILEVETKDFEDKLKIQPIASLTAGQTNMCVLDVSFDHRVPVTFRLSSGSGPLSISAQHLVEFPDESKEYGGDETATEQEDTEVDEEEVASLETSKKRKASAVLKNGKTKRGKMETGDDSINDDSMNGDEDDDEDDDEEEADMSEDDEEDMSEDDDEEVESSPDTKKSKKKAKNVKGATTNGKVVKGKKGPALKKGKASPPAKKAAKKVKGK